MPAVSHILHPTRNLVSDWRPGDAEVVTDMLLEGYKAFPGGGGFQFTPEQCQRMVRGDRLAAFVTEDRGQIIAYCDVLAKPGQREHCYIPTLACRPDHHGRKHGKSVLHATVEWAAAAGFARVDLNTWAGNMMAVPLYKKSGFMWRPGTTVFMENFVPTARRHPLGQAFFARHDWYATLQRVIELRDDGVARGKVKVYEYLWRADDDYLRMVFDRNSWRLIEAETPQLSVSCQLPNEALVAGMPHPVTWRVEHKGTAPVQVFLNARGEPGVEIAQREARSLRGAARFAGSVTVDPEIADKTKDPTAALLTTQILIDDTEVQLDNGIRVRQAVDVALPAPRGVVWPEEPQTLRLTLRSHLDKRAAVRLRLRAVDNVELATRTVRLELGAHASAEVPVALRAPRTGAVRFEAQAEARVGGAKVPTKAFALTALACARDGLAGAVGDDTCMLCAGPLLLFASRDDGGADLHHRFHGERAHRIHLSPPQLGPPFSWQDLFQEKGEAWIEEGPGQVCLHLRTGSVLHAGVAVHRRIRLDRSPLVEVLDHITNGGDGGVELQRRQNVRLRSRTALPGRRGLPLADGLTVERHAAGRDLDDWNPPDGGDAWAETWMAQEGDDGLVAGLIWDRAGIAGAGGGLDQDLGRLRPGQTVAAPTVHLLLGDGTADTVRGWWRLLHGPAFDEADAWPARRRAPIDLGLDPDPLLLRGARRTVTLRLTNAGRFEVDGKLHVDAGEGVACTAPRPVRRLTVDTPVSQRLTLRRTPGAAPGSDELLLRFENDEAEYRQRARVAILHAEAQPVTVTEEEDTYRVDNGLLAIRVAPAFLGAVVSLRAGGQEFLNSSWPDGGQRGWRNPWHGGIHLSYRPLWGSLHHERFRARVVERRGAQGLVWRGIRVSTKATQERARHHTLLAEYLLAPGADVLAIVHGRRDTLGEWLGGGLGLDIWSNLAETPGSGHFEIGDDGFTPRAAPHWFQAGTWDWGGLVSADGRALFTGGSTPDTRTGGWAEGPEGCVLFCEVCAEVPAGGRSQGTFFVAPAASVDAARNRSVWGAFDGLP